MNKAKTSAKDSNQEFDANQLVTIAICVFLALIVWIGFGQSIRHEFVNYDDDHYIYNEPNVSAGLTLTGLEWAFTHPHADNWHPLTTISHMVDVQLYGLNPFGHHLTNILIQAAAAIFLFFALRKLTAASAVIDRRYNIWACAFVAAVFAVHPLRVESVAWVAERKDVLSGLFFSLTLLAYARYARAKRESLGRYTIVVALFGLGLMCKPTLVTLPFVLLLLDYWPLQRMQGARSREQGGKSQAVSGKREAGIQNHSTSQPLNTSTSLIGLVFEKIPLFILAAISCAVTWIVQQEAFAAIHGLPLRERIANAAISYVIYLKQTVYPTHLAVLYPYPEGSIPISQALLASLCLAIVSIAAVLWRKKLPYLFTGWFWFLGMLVPMIGVVQVGSQAHADRYTYLPQIGLVIMMTWGVRELWSRWLGRREILAALAGLAITALTVCSYVQTSYWRNGETLWTHTIQNTSGNYIAHNNFANWLLQRGRLDEAFAEARAALAINADLEEAHVTLGNLFVNKGDPEAAAAEFRIALQARPDFAVVRSNLGNVLLQQGQVSEAIAQYERALATNPNSAEVRANLGNAFCRTGRIDDGIAQYERALQLNPRFAEAHNNLGIALAQKGQSTGAIAQYEQAIALKANYAEPEYNLGNAYLQSKQTQEAIDHYQKALLIKPDYVDAQYNLAKAFANLGEYDAAIAECQAILRAKPDHAGAYNNLGCFFLAVGRTDDAIKEFKEALRVDPNYLDAHYNLGRLLLDLGQRQEAIAHLIEIERLDPNYGDAKQILRELGVASSN